MTPSPTPIVDAATLTKAAGWIDSIIGIISGAVQNPYLAIAAVVVVLAGGLLGYFLISGKITAWRRQLAQRETEHGKQDFVDHEVPANQTKNDQDQANRDRLKDLP